MKKINQKREQIISSLLNPTTQSYLKIENIFSLMNIADEDSLNAIIEVMEKDKCELVRHEAAFALGEMASEMSIEFLKKCHINDNSCVVKHETLMSLGTVGNKKDLEFISEALKSDIYEVWASAQIAYERINQENDFSISDEKDLSIIIEDYASKLLNPKDTTRNDRIQIIFQLMCIGDDLCIDIIYNCLFNDPCPIVRHEAAFALGEIGCDKSVFYLEDALQKEENPIVIHEGLFALGTSGKNNVKEFLKKYLNHEQYIISESAKIAIDRLHFLEKPYSGKEEYEYLKYGKRLS